MMLKGSGSEPPDSPPPPYSGCTSPDPYIQDEEEEKYDPQGQHGPIIHGHKPPGARGGELGHPHIIPQQPKHHTIAQHQGQHPPPQPYHPSTYSATCRTAGGNRVIITQPHLGGNVRGRGLGEEEEEEAPKSYLLLAIVTCLCFSPLLGIIAICFSVASHSAFDSGNRESSKFHGKMALGLSIAGIVLSLVLLTFLLFTQGYL